MLPQSCHSSTRPSTKDVVPPSYVPLERSWNQDITQVPFQERNLDTEIFGLCRSGRRVSCSSCERALSNAHSSIQWHGAGARCRTLDEEEEGAVRVLVGQGPGGRCYGCVSQSSSSSTKRKWAQDWIGVGSIEFVCAASYVQELHLLYQ